MKFAAKLDQPKEKEAVALGDDAVPPPLRVRSISPARPAMPPKVCASGCRACRILDNPEAARKVIGEWPAYRVSSTHVMTMQHRLYDCYWQMRMPELELGSDVSVALIAYLTKKAEGGEISAPALKR